jgi:hypothetical protein
VAWAPARLFRLPLRCSPAALLLLLLQLTRGPKGRWGATPGTFVPASTTLLLLTSGVLWCYIWHYGVL